MTHSSLGCEIIKCGSNTKFLRLTSDRYPTLSNQILWVLLSSKELKSHDKKVNDETFSHLGDVKLCEKVLKILRHWQSKLSEVESQEIMMWIVNNVWMIWISLAQFPFFSISRTLVAIKSSHKSEEKLSKRSKNFVIKFYGAEIRCKKAEKISFLCVQCSLIFISPLAHIFLLNNIFESF